jgi:hypothetical protein
MPERWPNPNEKVSVSKNENHIKTLGRSIRNGIISSWDKMKEEIVSHPLYKDRPLKEVFIEVVYDRTKKLIGEEKASEVIATIQQNIASIEDEKEIQEKVISGLTHFLATSYSTAEIEALTREHQRNDRGYKEINRLVTYEIDPVDPQNFRIHIPTTFSSNPKELVRLFKDALSKIADLLRSEESLHDIQKVSGSSWIIFKNPTLLEKFGFTIIQRNEEKGVATAEISKDDIIRLYGSQ